MSRMLLALVCALIVVPSTSFAQSCAHVVIYQEFSYNDTLNSSGSALGSAYAVFQQDRFYVNERNRLDTNDRTDELLVTREVRAAYGQAVKQYLNAKGKGNMSAQALIGSHYVVDVETCGALNSPSVIILSMRLGGASSNIQQLETTNACVRCDLRGANLFDYDLNGANLEGANLDDAILEEANLLNANLKGASMVGALLERANLAGADLEDVNLESAGMLSADLSGANLKNAWLRGADLSVANLENANLQNAMLKFAFLNDTRMSGVILCRTIMPDGSEISSGCQAISTAVALTKQESDRMSNAGMCTVAAVVGNEVAKLAGKPQKYGIFKTVADNDVRQLRSKPGAQKKFEDSYNQISEVFEKLPTLQEKATMLLPLIARCSGVYEMGLK